jgi:hypothetical protein
LYAVEIGKVEISINPEYSTEVSLLIGTLQNPTFNYDGDLEYDLLGLVYKIVTNDLELL